ncbi:GNAT family N-acetyltransferase [Nonomuraea sp. NPDC049784]|uniref:GNAT family N-acetyltransferase n=1 Tax=Nonomuraea sp. NPDC049784 TaxID=3154361 RepID=UPI0033E68D24
MVAESRTAYVAVFIPAPLRWWGGWREDTMYHFAVETRDDGELVASVNVHRHHDTWAVGYWTVAEHRGRGYAAEAVLALATWSFTELGCSAWSGERKQGIRPPERWRRRSALFMEGVLRAAQTINNSLRDTWIGALRPSDLGCPFAIPYHAAQASSGLAYQH